MLERLGSSHSSVLIFFSLLTCSANSCLNPLLWNPLPATPTAIDMRAFLLFAKHFRKSTFLPGPLHYCSLCPSDSSIAQCFTTFRRLLQYWLFWSLPWPPYIKWNNTPPSQRSLSLCCYLTVYIYLAVVIMSVEHDFQWDRNIFVPCSVSGT